MGSFETAFCHRLTYHGGQDTQGGSDLGGIGEGPKYHERMNSEMRWWLHGNSKNSHGGRHQRSPSQHLKTVICPTARTLLLPKWRSWANTWPWIFYHVWPLFIDSSVICKMGSPSGLRTCWVLSWAQVTHRAFTRRQLGPSRAEWKSWALVVTRQLIHIFPYNTSAFFKIHFQLYSIQS